MKGINKLKFWQVLFVVHFSEEMNAKELARETGMCNASVRNVCDRLGIKLKMVKPHGKEKRFATVVKFKRPPAIYTNSKSPYGIASSMK